MEFFTRYDQFVDVLNQYHPSQFRRAFPAATRLCSVLLFLAGVGAWTAVVTTVAARFILPDDPSPPFVVGTVGYYLVGHGLAAVGYILARRIDVGVGLPGLGDAPVVVVAWSAPVALIGALWLVGTVTGVTVSELTRTQYAASVGRLFFLQTAGGPAVTKALAVGVLLFGVVQERLRAVIAPGHAVGLTVLVAGVFDLLPFVPTGTPLLPPVLLFGFGVLVSLVAGAAVGIVYQFAVRADTTSSADTLSLIRGSDYLPLIAVGGIGILLILTGLAEFPEVVMTPLWMVVVGTGAFAYERTGSLWPAVVTVFVYEFGLSLAAYVEALLGLAGL